MLFIIESGQHRIACFDFTGKNLLNPDRMTVKQLQDALKARGLLHNAEKLKRRELVETLSEWIENQNKKDGSPSANEKTGSRQVKSICYLEIKNQPGKWSPTVITSDPVEKDILYVGDFKGVISKIKFLTNRIKIEGSLLSSISLDYGPIWGISFIERSIYISASGDEGGTVQVDFESKSSTRVLKNGTDEVKRVHGLCARHDNKLIFSDRDGRQIKCFDICNKSVQLVAGSGKAGFTDGSETTASFSQPTSICCEKEVFQSLWLTRAHKELDL